MYFKRLFRTSLKTILLLTGNYDNEEKETKRPEKEVVEEKPLTKEERYQNKLAQALSYAHGHSSG